MTVTLLFLCFVCGAFFLGRMSAKSDPTHVADNLFGSLDRYDVSDEPVPMNPLRLFTLVFLIFWIALWSFGIGMVLKTLISGQGPIGASLFLIFWLVLAVAGWGVAASTIYRLLTGKKVKGRKGIEY